MVSRVPLDATALADDDSALLQALGGENRALSEAGPVLRYLVRADDSSLLNDEVVARVRGMLTHLARQLAETLTDERADDQIFDALVQSLVAAFFDSPVLLNHAHGLALEWQLAERMQGRFDLDPILPPLLQARISADDPVVSDTAREMLAAQARFGQNMRRMELPLHELPGDLFHLAVRITRALAEESANTSAKGASAEARLRQNYEERDTRLGLIERVLIALREDAGQALVMERAGVAIFLTALAIGSGQSRDAAVFAMAAAQPLRLALSLTVCGLSPEARAAQVLAVHPDAILPEGVTSLHPEQAAHLLAQSHGAG